MPTDRQQPSASRRQAQRSERRQRYRKGHSAERIAAIWLTLKGYRILAKRQRTPAGEIDLIAVRRQRIAFIEVKRRKTPDEAESSITKNQRQRIRRAANLWLSRKQRFQAYDIGFDLVFLVPWHWPRHIENGL
ncbi:MAG: YraN family protein [Alphaproteobacteria bacterium]|nr:YraN family protein [Alphaproteobacteria bacterium]